MYNPSIDVWFISHRHSFVSYNSQVYNTVCCVCALGRITHDVNDAMLCLAVVCAEYYARQKRSTRDDEISGSDVCLIF